MINTFKRILIASIMTIALVAFPAIATAHSEDHQSDHSATSISTPTLISCHQHNLTSSTHLKWTKVSGADGYKIYRKAGSSGTYTCIKTIKSSSTLSYITKTQKAGKTYYYKICAYDKYYTSSGKCQYHYGNHCSSKHVSVCATKPSITSCTQTSNTTGTCIRWNKVANASGYKIYRKTGSTGTYTCIKIVKGTSNLSYTTKAQTVGKTYYYKVKAYQNYTSNGKSHCRFTSYSKSHCVKIHTTDDN